MMCDVYGQAGPGVGWPKAALQDGPYAQAIHCCCLLPAGHGDVREGDGMLEAGVRQCARHGEEAGEKFMLA